MEWSGQIAVLVVGAGVGVLSMLVRLLRQVRPPVSRVKAWIRS